MYFQILRNLALAPKLIVSTIFLFLIVPTHPLKGSNGHWVELIDQAEGRDSYDLLTIYSVLRTYRMDLRDSTAWEICETILGESLKYSLDPLLVLAVINVESRFQQAAVSTKGARGLMQIRPFVGIALAQEPELGFSLESKTLNPESLDDPVLNIRLGVFYLKELAKSFQDLKVALTAYNWGPTKIRNRLDGKEPLPLGYANKVLSTYQTYRKHESQGRQDLTEKF
jgi:soluble lytic murein transglycosylase